MAGSWSDSDEDAVTAHKSGEILFEVLTGLKHIGKLSAKDVCIIGWWVAQAGAVGPVRALAKALGDPSIGHYSMHFDSVCGTVKDNPKQYSLQVPMFDRAEGLRKEQSLACLPPHEALVDELEGEEAWHQKSGTTWTPRRRPTGSILLLPGRCRRSPPQSPCTWTASSTPRREDRCSASSL